MATSTPLSRPPLSTAGTYRLYVASLNLGSINVAISNDNGKTFSQIPVQAGIPVDDREWIAAYGADTSLLTYHDIATSNIDVLRSDNGGGPYTQIAQAIPDTDYKATNNELGNLVIDHNNPTRRRLLGLPVVRGALDRPGATNSATYNEAFLAVSSDGGTRGRTSRSRAARRSAPTGSTTTSRTCRSPRTAQLYYAVTNDKSIYVAKSSDHGNTWTCSGAVSTATQAIFPWIVATSAGEDLVYYGAIGTGRTARPGTSTSPRTRPRR